ncbi:MAG: hypothetical protein HY757_00620 [Nitrospirae bacterium]|nr:hypothetical protein [Nitrospirota bacterium]
MKIIKLSIVLYSIIFVMTVFSSLSIAGNNNQGQSEGQAEPRIAFNFVDVEISTLIKFISEITGDNFLFDERIKGTITIIAPTKLTVEESFNLFTSVLSLKGFTIIPSGPNTYKIIPSSLAKQEGIISTNAILPVNEGYITKLIPVDNIKAEEALQFIRPVISKDGHLSSFGPHNMLLAVDSAVTINKIMSILSLIDKPSIREEEASIHVYFLEHADATDLSEVLQGIIKNLQTAVKNGRMAQKGGDASAVPVLNVTPDKATNSLVIIAPPSDYENIVQVIKTLDKKRKQVFVEAMIVEARIDMLRDLGSKWRAMATHKGEPVAVGGVGNIGTDTVLNIINGLSGFSVGGMGSFLDIPVTSVGTDGTVSSQTLTSPGFAALFSLSEFRRAINVLSTPQILTSDNQEAEILVGENVPFISQRERDVTTTSTVLNSIQRTDVGIKLKITPQISEGDYIKLDIFQEISSVEKASDVILTTIGPSTTKRSTKTSVVVKDGLTVVIGGLMQEQEQEDVFKVPILGDIPVLGWLFKFKSVSKNKTNLLVFLSPHIIKEAPQIAKMTQEKHKDFVTREKFYRQGELLVKFKEDVPEDMALLIISQKKASVIRHFDDINVYHIKLKSGQEVEDAINEFSSVPEVLYAEPNYKVKLDVPAEDTDKKQPAPDIELNKPDSLLHEENTETLKVTDAEQAAPAVDIGNSADLNNEDSSLPPPGIDKKKIPPDNKSEDPGSILLEQTPSSLKVIDNNQAVPVADARAEGDALAEKVNEPQQNQLTDKTNASEAVNKKSSQYYIQVGAWINIKYAMETLELLRPHYPDIYIVEDNSFNKVRIPGTMSKKNDALLLNKLRKKFNLRPFLVNPNKADIEK